MTCLAKRLRPAGLGCALLVGTVCGTSLVGCSSGSGPATSDAPATTSTASAPTAAPLPSDDELKAQLDRVLAFTGAREMNVEDHAAWQIVHGVLAYGRDLKIKTARNGESVPALDYILGGGYLKGWTMRPGSNGLDAIVEAGSKTGQGHPDQWLGYLSQIGLKPEDRVVAAGKDYTVGDLISQAQADIYEGKEAIWTLMAFSSYLPLDAKWTAKDGQEWTIERIMAMENKHALSDPPCGGAHRLYGLTCAVNRYLAEGRTLEGIWKEADEKIQAGIKAAREFQQPDGMLSSRYFERPAKAAEVGEQMGSAGHVLEFVVLAASNDQIREPWLTRAVVRMCNLFEKTKDLDMECGALYHAAHGLQLYRLRRFSGPAPGPTTGDTAVETAAVAEETEATAR